MSAESSGAGLRDWPGVLVASCVIFFQVFIYCVFDIFFDFVELFVGWFFGFRGFSSLSNVHTSHN